MTVPAWVIAVVRSGVQVLVAALLNQDWAQTALNWLTETVGLNLTENTITNATFTVAFGLVVALTNWLGKQDAFQWVNKVISLFLASSPAVYEKTGIAGGEGHPADVVSVDMGGEGVATTEEGGKGEKGAVTLSLLLVLVATFIVALILFGVEIELVWAVLALCAAHLVGPVDIG